MVRRGKQEYKNIFVRKSTWARLKKLALERETTLIQLIDDLLDHYEKQAKKAKRKS